MPDESLHYFTWRWNEPTSLPIAKLLIENGVNTKGPAEPSTEISPGQSSYFPNPFDELTMQNLMRWRERNRGVEIGSVVPRERSKWFDIWLKHHSVEKDDKVWPTEADHARLKAMQEYLAGVEASAGVS